ncbi:hypothetical protein JN00_0192 [Metamycoplasma subdolum]|uniref:Uncharacterized protein n=1 Tax=Metamycoplasma subdolum TaxID=92407 RepID=A0A3M0A8K8_9BACT|nr:hypothetical protein [Metamycoplasma subdolum]RMA79138.1 hypothetical protein JN00_0192 [Metamycoplasma subdolum]WPB50660.1 hypothetical protein R9C05_00680 [Metamycoplasma subdolum]
MTDIKNWLEYYANSKKILRKLQEQELKNVNLTFFNLFKTFEGKIIAKEGLGLNAFNEVTVKLIASQFVNFLKESKIDLQTYYVLLATDKVSKNSNKILDYFAEVLAAQRIKVLRFKDDIPVTKSFLSFTLEKTETIQTTIYFSEYSNLNSEFALSFIENNSLRFTNDKLSKILENYEKQNALTIKVFIDEPIYLDTKKLLDEYATSVETYNFKKSGNKLIKIGVFSSITNLRFVQKILGRNDIYYTILKEKNKKETYEKLYKNFFCFKKLDYIVRFSKDQEKIYFYEWNRNKIFPKYNLVSFNKLFAVYLSFALTNQNTNEEFEPIKHVIYGPGLLKQIFLNFKQKYEIETNQSLIIQDEKVQLLKDKNIIYVDEEGHLFLGKKHFRKYDQMVSLSVLTDILNYIKTQNKTIDEIYEEIVKGEEKLYTKIFTLKLDINKLEGFETKLFLTNELAKIKVNKKDDLRKFANTKLYYLAKVTFEENEFVLIRYLFEENKLIFEVTETEKTKENIFKRLKKFFARFITLIETDQKDFTETKEKEAAKVESN